MVETLIYTDTFYEIRKYLEKLEEIRKESLEFSDVDELRKLIEEGRMYRYFISKNLKAKLKNI